MEDAAAQEGAYLRLLHSRQANGWMRLVAKVDSDPAFTPPFPNYVPRADYGPPPKNRYPRTTKDLWLYTALKLSQRKPQLMALSTDDDEPVDWLRAGEALQRAILTGARYGLSVLVPDLSHWSIRTSLAWHASGRGTSRSPKVPQMVMRVGYATVPTSALQPPDPEIGDLT